MKVYKMKTNMSLWFRFKLWVRDFFRKDKIWSFAPKFTRKDTKYTIGTGSVNVKFEEEKK